MEILTSELGTWRLYGSTQGTLQWDTTTMFSESETPVLSPEILWRRPPGQITVDGQALLLRMTAPQYELHELTIPSWPKFVPGDLSTIDNEKWEMPPIVGMSHSIMPRTTRLSAICHPCLLSMRCLMDKARRIFSINRPSSTSRSSFGLPIIWNS
jgi:hypothetical protein